MPNSAAGSRRIWASKRSRTGLPLRSRIFYARVSCPFITKPWRWAPWTPDRTPYAWRWRKRLGHARRPRCTRNACPCGSGHRVFTRRNLARETIREAADVFARFREIFDRYDTAHLRAVATSAARNARNRNALVDAVRDASGIELEIIDGAEEARLIRTAVLAALPDGVQPRLIMDLGGGSLEFNLLRDGELEYTATIPVGAVRLLEMFDASGVINAKQEAALRAYVNEVLGAHLPAGPTWATISSSRAAATR
ncbi:MAG: hypothetical protein M5R36_03300 [Deltaproteobacteria bacterium]|nr:hypothetical protein [Deltaproteobacteria bacterium]